MDIFVSICSLPWLRAGTTRYLHAKRVVVENIIFLTEFDIETLSCSTKQRPRDCCSALEKAPMASHVPEEPTCQLMWS